MMAKNRQPPANMAGEYYVERNIIVLELVEFLKYKL